MPEVVDSPVQATKLEPSDELRPSVPVPKWNTRPPAAATHTFDVLVVSPVVTVVPKADPSPLRTVSRLSTPRNRAEAEATVALSATLKGVPSASTPPTVQ